MKTGVPSLVQTSIFVAVFWKVDCQDVPCGGLSGVDGNELNLRNFEYAFSNISEAE